MYRGINDFMEGYQPRTNIDILKEEKGDVIADSHSILARRRKHFSQKFHVHRNIDARQTEIKTAELLVPGPSAFEFQMAIETLNRHEPPGIDQIPDELFKQGVAKFVLRSINVLILFGMKRNCLRSGRSRSVPIYKKGNETYCSNYRGILLLQTT